MIEQPNNPLHGMTLEKILNILVEHYGWDELSNRINIRCFYNNPSIKSSLSLQARKLNITISDNTLVLNVFFKFFIFNFIRF